MINIPTPAIRFGVAVTHVLVRDPRFVNKKTALRPIVAITIPGMKNLSIKKPNVHAQRWPQAIRWSVWLGEIFSLNDPHLMKLCSQSFHGFCRID
jgi:hypothetical protein